MGSAAEGASNVQEDLERHQHQPSPGLPVRRDLQLRPRLHLRHGLGTTRVAPAELFRSGQQVRRDVDARDYGNAAAGVGIGDPALAGAIDSCDEVR